MITHIVKTDSHDSQEKGPRKIIYVSASLKDLELRDTMISFKQRWEFYTQYTFDFLCFDVSLIHESQQKKNDYIVWNLSRSNGCMVLVSGSSALDSLVKREIAFAIEKRIPITGIDIRKGGEGEVPESLNGKMIRYGWEWFAQFIDSL